MSSISAFAILRSSAVRGHGDTDADDEQDLDAVHGDQVRASRYAVRGP